MEKYTMVKSEVQENGDIFLYYVDENGASENDGVVTIDQSQIQQLQENYDVLEEVQIPIENEFVDNVKLDDTDQTDLLSDSVTQNRWSDDEIKKLLTFLIDNKTAFQFKSRKQHLWTVACKTMLPERSPMACEAKLQTIKKKYVAVFTDYLKHKVNPNSWPYYKLCHEAFQGDDYVKTLLKEKCIDDRNSVLASPLTKPEEVKKTNKAPDENMRQMLDLYLQYKTESGKNNSWQKYVWEKISIQLGEDGDYWHKRFLNFKQHYIRLIEKRNSGSQISTAWPYIGVFDEIFKDDDNFQRKYGNVKVNSQIVIKSVQIIPTLEWDDTEKTVLVKYCFDSFDEFQDPTIPKAFLWNEVGRLLDKKGDSCKEKYEELKNEHLNQYSAGVYTVQARKPIAILFDTIISKEVEKKLSVHLSSGIGSNVEWETEMFDSLVQFLFDNVELFKDPACHFVCWAAIAFKLGQEVEICRDQWKQLTELYKSILNDKKEDSDLQIDWRYIELFDRIFDYGMDTNLLDGYEKLEKKETVKKSTKLEDMLKTLSDYEEFDEKSSGKRARGTEDPKAVKILEYYFKNKDKFATSSRKKYAVWEVLAQQLGISAEQCAHRLRNLKQIYTTYIQREINKPDVPVLWPYYNLCKKVFGYRAIKNKLKNGKLDSDDAEEWSTKEIKMVINYLGKYFNEINSNVDDTSKWAELAKEIDKSKASCRDKFLDLRKSYRKIKTMMSKNPDCKVNWKFFKMFDEIYSKEEVMEVDSADDMLPSNADTAETQDDDDFQCIIVVPEGEEIDINNAEIIIKNPYAQPLPKSKIRIPWSRKQKMKLLNAYYNYINAREGKVINVKEMWKDLATSFPKRDLISCKRMFIRIKVQYKKLIANNELDKINDSSVYSLFKKILTLKRKFVRPPYTAEDVVLTEKATYTDISLPLWRVEKGLKYYLDHVEEFVNPKYDKKYAWIDLAKYADLPVTKIFKKINYLKQFYNSETNEVNGEKFEFGDTLKEILEKEFICKIAIESIPEPMSIDDGEANWSEEETEQLLIWYLNNLDKFKNPKYLPSYLWLEASNVLSKSPVACSKKMNDIRSQYSAMMKESPDALNNWRFYDLCQKIYGTGKKSSNDD